MESAAAPRENLPAKPICVGLTCWLWERRRPQAIVQLAVDRDDLGPELRPWLKDFAERL